MTWENERRAICRAMLDAADNGTTHAVYVCWTAYNGFADADALLGLGSGRYMELPPDERELARERVTALGRDLKAAAARHGEPEPTEARLTRVHGIGLELDVRTGRPEWAADPDGMPADLFLEWRAGLKTTRAARWARRHAVADADPLWESFTENGGCAEVVRTGPVRGAGRRHAGAGRRVRLERPARPRPPARRRAGRR